MRQTHPVSILYRSNSNLNQRNSKIFQKRCLRRKLKQSITWILFKGCQMNDHRVPIHHHGSGFKQHPNWKMLAKSLFVCCSTPARFLLQHVFIKGPNDLGVSLSKRPCENFTLAPPTHGIARQVMIP